MNYPSRFSALSQNLKGINLYLVGMMGSGKTQTAPYLAKELGYRFIDIDQQIEKATQRTISEIFQSEGESIFRSFESEVLKEIGQRHSFVVATGGGLVTSSINWGILHQGLSIWLDPGRNRLLKRLQLDTSKRPLLETKNPTIALDDLLKQRESMYSKSDLHIKVEDESPEEVSLLILNQLTMLIKNQNFPDE